MADIEQSPTPDAANQPQDESEGGFSEAFAERASPSGKTEEAPEAGADAPADEGQSAATADTAQAPADKAAAGEGSGPKAEAFDPYAGMTPEQKAHWEKLYASERSNRGRVGALTKKLNGLTTGTQKPPKQTDEQDRGGDGGAGVSSETSASDIEARLDAAVEEYGDVIGPLAEVVKDLRKKIDGLKPSDNRDAVSDDDAEAMAEAYDKLAEKHPDYQQIAANPAFHEWAGKQPDKVKALVNSFDPEEVSLGLTLFKAESGAATHAAGDGGEGADGGNASGQRRERQLDGLRQTPNRGAPAATGVPNDFKSAFKSRATAAR